MSGVGKCEKKKRSENGLKYLKRKEKPKAHSQSGEHCKKSYKTSFAMGLGRG